MHCRDRQSHRLVALNRVEVRVLVEARLETVGECEGLRIGAIEQLGQRRVNPIAGRFAFLRLIGKALNEKLSGNGASTENGSFDASPPDRGNDCRGVLVENAEDDRGRVRIRGDGLRDLLDLCEGLGGR